MKILNEKNLLCLTESQMLRQYIVLSEKFSAFNKISGPRTGDFVIMPNGGHRRICIMHWADYSGECQITPTETSGSFNIDGGACSYSGSCGEMIKLSDLRFTHTYCLGRVWFFKDGFPAAHSGIDAEVPMRVFSYEPNEQGF